MLDNDVLTQSSCNHREILNVFLSELQMLACPHTHSLRVNEGREQHMKAKRGGTRGMGGHDEDSDGRRESRKHFTPSVLP